MSPLVRELATGFYRQAARLSARLLASSPIVESVSVHRSVATGEVSFGRSDIDLLLVVDGEEAENGASLAELYRAVRRARLLVPALGHIDVYDPGSLASHARMDTFWASVERRTLMPLGGKRVEIPTAPVHPDHALRKFLLWVEWFFAIAVRERNRRNLRKTALESWNAYAAAEGLIPEPCLLRADMEAQARRMERNLVPKRLEEPGYATRFVLELADRLHRSRLPGLGRLDRPLVLEAITSPLCLRRRIVVLPRADSPLPPEAFLEGSFPCTPEFLDLFLHVKNAFLSWILPTELLDLGMKLPGVCGYVRSCREYGHDRFLLSPGFGTPGPPMQAARMAQTRHAVAWASRGEVPPPIPQEEIRQMMTEVRPILDYYRVEYSPLRRESRSLQESLLTLAGEAANR